MSSETDKGCEEEEEEEEEGAVVRKRRVRRGKHELFDKMAFNVLTYLETFSDVGDIEFYAPEGNSTACALWEGKNSPYLLPQDVKGFANLFNGLSLKWAVDVGNKGVNVGEIKINKVEAMIKVDLGGVFLKHEEREVTLHPPDTSIAVGFEIARSVDGIVVMLCRTKPLSETDIPNEIWFQDFPTNTWHFICHTFTQYLRLCVLHLGIFGWHKIFTPDGISMTTRQWMGMFCKERLCVYQHYMAQKNKSS